MTVQVVLTQLNSKLWSVLLHVYAIPLLPILRRHSHNYNFIWKYLSIYLLKMRMDAYKTKPKHNIAFYQHSKPS